MQCPGLITRPASVSMNSPLGPTVSLVEDGIVRDLLQHHRHVDENHREGVSLTLHDGLELGRHPLLRIGDELADALEERDRLLRPRLVAARERVFRVGDRGEALGEHVAALLEAHALRRHGEVGAPVLGKAVLFKELAAALRRLQPFGILLHVVVGVGRHPSEAALEPDALRRVHQRTVAVDARVDAAVLAVPAVLHPERHHVTEQLVLVGLSPLAPIVFICHL